MTGETYMTDMATSGNAVTGAWAAWTPALTGATTNPTTSAATGRYTQVGKTVLGQFEITVSTAGSGTYYVSVPVTGHYDSDQTVGQGWLYHSSTAQLVQCLFRFDTNGTRFRPFFSATTNIAADSSHPWVWASGDLIHGLLTYEAA